MLGRNDAALGDIFSSLLLQDASRKQVYNFGLVSDTV